MCADGPAAPPAGERAASGPRAPTGDPTLLLGKLVEIADWHADALLEVAPCLFCGYNGPGFYQANTHRVSCPWYRVGGIKPRRARLVPAVRAALAAAGPAPTTNQMSTKDELVIGRAATGAPPSEARNIVNEQADDDGLWCEAATATEAYLQQALRRLHAAVERETGGETGPLAGAPPREPSAAQRLEWVATALHGDPLFGAAAFEPLVQQISALRAGGRAAPTEGPSHE